MRILHTGDLHIGKNVNNFSMLSEQQKVLTEMAGLAEEYQVQAFIIAGDIYDRGIPTAEAVMVMNDFLEQLQKLHIDVLIISGNHDSPERISFAQKILEKQSLHIAGVYQNTLKQVILKDQYGEIVFTLMPFIKASILQKTTSQEAVMQMLADTFQKKSDIRRQVLVTHFFVTNAGREPQLSDSETPVSVGGLDQVDAGCFDRFCYTALGHIHKPQRMNETGAPVVYAGSPLSYSFSECGQEKSVVLADIGADGAVKMERLPLHPIHQMRKIRGKLEALICEEVLMMADREDYLQITLTNEEELIDPMGTLRNYYPNIMQLLFEKKMETESQNLASMAAVEQKTTEELFSDFYKILRDKDMDEDRKHVIEEVVKEIL